ncbi:hypothetical protein [Sporosarcina sp. BP05]|uniref:hypothetical protein n=1 Tax=Sporosarcina sp. BP05 TaxID=2758726 RepID=UPI0016474C14|nr:hypothetical protein [Sporosarcina sp. BP05]
MDKLSKKVLFGVAAISIALNLAFAINYFLTQKEKKYDLIQAVDRILSSIDYASSLLNDGDEKDPDYEKNIKLAAMNIAASRGWIESQEKDMPRNLVSWIGGVELGLRNGVHGIDEEGFQSTVQDLKNFMDGYKRGSGNLQSSDYKEMLEKIEDVLGSQEYMGDHYIR